jgi:hypothetical protein
MIGRRVLSNVRGFEAFVSAMLSRNHVFMAVVILVILLPICRAIVDGWVFPWYGHPDQDLVFLADGYRLATGRPPIYADHPGAVVALICAFALYIYNFSLTASGFPSLTTTATPSDAQWQGIFVVAKLINATAVVALIFICALLLLRWLNRLHVVLWSLLVSASLATQVELYQLRNEFFSAFLAYVAFLLTVNWLAGSCCSTTLRRPLYVFTEPYCFEKSWQRAAVVFLCLWFSVLAKIQSYPLIIIFALGVFAWISLQKSRSQLIAKAIQMSLACALVIGGFSGVLSGRSIDLPQAIIASFFVLFPPLLCLISDGQGELIAFAKNKTYFLLAAPIFLVVVATSSFLSKGLWLSVPLQPLSMANYVEGGANCLDLPCRLRLGTHGIFYLFERSFDGSIIVWFALLFVGLLVFFLIERSSMDRAALVPLLLVTTAFAMAFLAGQRYAVDQYLNYQQPLFFLGLLRVAEGGAGSWRSRLSKILLLVSIVSILLIFNRYSRFSRMTYVLPVDAMSNARKIEYHSLYCSRQHQGDMWKKSRIGSYCNW